MVQWKEIKTEEELQSALELCYRILGEHLREHELYSREAWQKRLADGLQPLVCAKQDGHIVSAVLGRAENADSLVIGFVACDESHRGQGITSRLMRYFEELARGMGFKAITLGSQADEFYEQCGYHVIAEMHGQNIYQKLL
ncbi:MAG: GNAT family N-acetyltransferase [Christensenellaceae bacterium]|nr:GNAT family N-acetyltransferase [Christensenellaceae bacterium]